MKSQVAENQANENKTDEQAQIEILKGVLDRMDASGRKEPDPNSDDVQERADAAWLAEMREAKAEADEQARVEYEYSLNLLEIFGFFHGDAGASVREELDETIFEVDSGILHSAATIDWSIIVPADPSAESMLEGVLRLEQAGFAESICVTEPEGFEGIAALSFKLRPSFVVQAADFLSLCEAPEIW